MPLFKIRDYNKFTPYTYFHLMKIKLSKQSDNKRREIREVKDKYEKLLKKQELNVHLYEEYTNIGGSLRKNPMNGENVVIMTKPGNDYIESMLVKLACDITTNYKVLKQLEKEHNEIKRKHIDPKILRFILKEFFQEVGERIVENDKFDFGNVLGTFFTKVVKSAPRHNKTTGEYHYPIDWVKSREMKQRLIADGKEPYHSINNPNGVKWLIYNLEDRIFIHWHRFTLPNSLYSWYLFTPVSHIASYLHRYYTTNPDKIKDLKVYDKTARIV